MGDPCGIGPEIALHCCAKDTSFALVGHRAVLERIAQELSYPLPKQIIESGPSHIDATQIRASTVQAEGGAMAVAAVERAIAGCLAGEFSAMVTAPLNKEAAQLAGMPFPGHTELLADRCGSENPIMALTGPDLTVALATCHQSLRDVVNGLRAEHIVRAAQLLSQALHNGTTAPKLALLGLNPHAGENGLLGDDEQRIHAPALAALRQQGVDIEGPLPPDTAFIPANRARYDGFVCCYHDQGLIPFKALCFDQGVNWTLGLPIIRTSPDHGTAFDLARSGKANPASLQAAIDVAQSLVKRRGARARCSVKDVS